MRRLVETWTLLTAISLACGGGNALAIDLVDDCREFRPITAMAMSKQIERPKPPFCAIRVMSFTDEFQFQSCRSEMLDYQGKIERFGKCLEQESSEAVSEFNATVASFNRLSSQ